MGTIENLNNTDAVKKIKELAEDARICMFCTDLTTVPIAARPMSVKEVDEEGNLWFISGADSNKNFEITDNPEVQLFFSNNDASEYLSVYGRAYIYTDRHTIEDKWSPMANAWFDGKDDERVTIIRVQPIDSKYWDTQDGKFVTLLKIATSTLTGSTHKEGGVEGKLDV